MLYTRIHHRLSAPLRLLLLSVLLLSGASQRVGATGGGRAPAPTKTMTFEHGQLVHHDDGADSVIDEVALETDHPLRGHYSAHFTSLIGHLNAYLAPTDALFVSFLIKPVSTRDVARIFLFRHDGVTMGNLQLTADDQLWLRIGDRRIGTAAKLPFGRVSRVSIYAQRGRAGTGVLAAYIAAPEAAFGAPFAQSTREAIDRPITSVRIGGTDYHAVDFIADDITLSPTPPGAAGAATPEPTTTTATTPTDAAPAPTAVGTATAAATAAPSGSLATFRPARIPFDAPELVNPLRGLYRWRGQEYATLPRPALDAYDRYTWRDLEPTLGDYRFTQLEQDITQAAHEGRKYAFRVRALVSEHGSSVPDYLMQRMARGWWHDFNHDGTRDTYVPDWNDPSFLERANALIAALGKRYNGDARVAFVDIGLYGNWGEWHTSSFPYPSPSGAQRATVPTLYRLVDMHIAAFPTTPLVMLTDNTEALVYAMGRSPRIGWRRDSLGWVAKDHFEKIETDPVRWAAIKDRWKTALVVTEFANPRVQSDPEVYQKALAQVRRYHISLVSNGNTLRWTSLSPEGKAAFVTLGKAAGYRLALDQLQLPQTLAPGQPFTLHTVWGNDGVAPVYEPWQVVVQLRRSGTDAVAWEAVSTLDLRSVLPGTPDIHADSLKLLASVAPGTYDVALLLRDPRGTRAPLQLATEGGLHDGSYRLGSITVREGAEDQAPLAPTYERRSP